MNKKSIKQLIKDATASRVPARVSSDETLYGAVKRASLGSKSRKMSDLMAGAGVGRKAKPVSTEMSESNKQSLVKLRDSLTELQASYANLNELFNNTVAAQDSTVASLLQDLRYVVSRLDKADFSLKYDVASESLFVDGEDSVAVPTSDVLKMLSYLTSLFPEKSISLSIDGDKAYKNGDAVDKLSEIDASKSPTVTASPEVDVVEQDPGTDIDAVLAGVGDSKLSDSSFEPENRFTCTYKDEAYSIWDKQLGILVKVVTSNKEADAMLEGLVAGASSSSQSEGVDESGDSDVDFDAIEEEPLDEGEELLDSKRVQDSALGLDSSWDECVKFDADYIKDLGWSAGKLKSFVKGISEGSFIPFFSQLPGFSSLHNDEVVFDLTSGDGLDFVNKNLDSVTEANKLLEGAGKLDAMSAFLTAYSNLLVTFSLSKD